MIENATGCKATGGSPTDRETRGTARNLTGLRYDGVSRDDFGILPDPAKLWLHQERHYSLLTLLESIQEWQ